MNRAIRIANAAGQETHASATIDNAFLAEDFFAIALRRAVLAVAANPSARAQLKRTYSLSVASGAVTLPDTVLDEYLNDSTAYLSTDANLLASFEPKYEDYLRAGDQYPQLAYYTSRHGQLLFRDAGAAAGATTGTVTLVAVGLPDIPTTITDAITASSDVVENTVLILAELIRGGATAAETNDGAKS